MRFGFNFNFNYLCSYEIQNINYTYISNINEIGFIVELLK